MNEFVYEIKQARKGFSRVGLALSVILVVTAVLQGLRIVEQEKRLRFG